jgi:PBSX family phage terminase large subunit
MEDNPSLDESYKNNLKREYKGLWYKRYIEGQWCLAEGTIYDFFDPVYHVITFPPTTVKYYILGVDYGTTNPTAMALIGYNPEVHPNIWLEKEYYWDSRKTNRQKTDTEFAEDLKKFIAGKPIKAIYLDPSAASFKAELRKQGVDGIYDAENEVVDGIRFQSLLLSNGTYKICRACKNAIEEYGQYRWDDKSLKLGVDKPLKENDHIMDAQRYALFTHFFNKSRSGDNALELNQRWEKVAYGQKFGGPFDGNFRR